MIGLCELVLLVQILSAPHTGEGCSGAPATTGVSASRTSAVNVVAVFVFGSSIGYSSVLSSGAPYSGPLALTVGLRQSVPVRSCRYAFSLDQSQMVATMFRSMPAGRGGLLAGSSPRAIRVPQSARYLIGRPRSCTPAWPIMLVPACPD